MAHFYRLIFCAIVAFAAWLPASSYASFPTSGTNYAFPTTGYGPGGPYLSTAQAACDWGKTTYLAAQGYSGAVTVSGTLCQYRFANGNLGPTYNLTSQGACSANATVSGGTCSCNSGYLQVAGACVLDTTAADALVSSLNESGDGFCSTTHQVTGFSMCSGGFAIRGSSIMTAATAKNTDGSLIQCIQGPFTTSGFACGANDNTGLSADGHCKAGKVPGTVNGVTVCVTAGSGTASQSSSTASAPSGSASAPTSGLGGSAPSTATGSTQTTTCASGSCTTTTKYTDSGGATVGTSTDTKPQNSFCKDNPGSVLCVQSAVSSTACGSPDACTGDAVSCAIESQVKATACALTTAPTNDSNINAFNTAAGQPQGDQTAAITSTVNLGPGSFDQTNILGAASGLNDLTVTVAGHAVTLPLSNVNVWLARLGVILQGVTFLLCARIVARG